MKNKTLLFSLFLFFSFQVVAQVNISRIFKNSPKVTSRATDFAQDAISLEADLDYINKVYNEKNEYISLTVPVSQNDEVTLQLERFNVLSKNAIIRTSGGDTLKNLDTGLFYRGTIRDRDGFATVSIFKDRIWSIVSIKGIGSINIVKYKDSDYNYIVYNDQKVNMPQSFECHTPDDIVPQDRRRVYDRVETRSDNCVKFYIEADYELYQDRGSVQGTKDWITAVFAEVATLYNNENINIEISEIKVWDTPDSYSNDDSNQALEQFGNANPNFNGDLASLYSLGGNNIGGLAWTDILCYKNYSYAYMNIFTNYQSVPTYSWTVEVITHEVGHNLGSSHTHACVWNGNNTQIDDCANQYYVEIGETPEGNACFDSNNPIIPESGTIMSYCHLVDGVGIDLTLGFGQQPGDLIRNRYNNATCLTACAGEQGEAPDANFESNVQQACLGWEVSFYDLSTESPTQWEWTFEGGTPSTSTDKNPSVTYNTPGVYSVTLTAKNANGQDTETKQSYITVYEDPIASYTYYIANDIEVHFTNNSQFADNYEWAFGDNTSSTDKDPVHTYTQSGNYTVVLYAYNQQCERQASYSLQVNIDADITAKMSYSTNKLCKGETVHFQDESGDGVTSRFWVFEGGIPATSTSAAPIVTYNSTGVYDVKLFVYNGIDSDTLIKSNLIKVNDVPTVTFTYTINGNTVVFENTSTGADSYKWDFGTGRFSTEEHPTFYYPQGGKYVVRLTATNECGSSTQTDTITISEEPIAKFSVQNGLGCVPFEAHFNNLSNTDNLLWQFPGGVPNTSTELTPVVVYNNPGSYDVTLYATNELGTDTIKMENAVVAFLPPQGDFTYQLNGSKVHFTQTTSNISGFEWHFGDGNASSQENPSHIYAQDGTYKVKFTYYNSCDTLTVQKDIVVVSPPIAGFEYDVVAGCAPLTVHFTNTSSANIDTLYWTFEGGIPYHSTEENPTVVFENKGKFDVSLYVKNSAGDNFALKSELVNVYGVPKPNFSKTSNGLAYTFTYTGEPANTVTWYFGDGTSSVGNVVEHTYANEQDYVLRVLAENECGKDTLISNLSVELNPTADFSSDLTSGCAPLEVRFNNLSSSSSSWIWSFEGGNPSVSIEENPLVFYTVGGKYDVKLIAIGEKGQDTILIEDYIVVDDGPNVDFSYEIDEATVQFSNLSSADARDFYWDFGDGTVLNEENPVHTYQYEGKYNVKLIASNDCGENSIVKEIEIIISNLQEQDFVKAKLYPNPNNGNFTVDFNSNYEGDFKAVIYNTNGQLLYDNTVGVSVGKNKLYFDVQTFNSGIYILELSNRDFKYRVLFNIE